MTFLVAMTPETVVTLGQRTLELILMMAGPLLMVGLLVGVLIGMFQAATQINEMTLSFVPKLLAVGLTLLFLGNWMLQMLMDFTRELISEIPYLIG